MGDPSESMDFIADLTTGTDSKLQGFLDTGDYQTATQVIGTVGSVLNAATDADDEDEEVREERRKQRAQVNILITPPYYYCTSWIIYAHCSYSILGSQAIRPSLQI